MNIDDYQRPYNDTSNKVTSLAPLVKLINIDNIAIVLSIA